MPAASPAGSGFADVSQAAQGPAYPASLPLPSGAEMGGLHPGPYKGTKGSGFHLSVHHYALGRRGWTPESRGSVP